jgi:uncharacterized membrane protein YqaE (UPF0057 family)
VIVIAVLLPWLALLLGGHFFQAAFCLGLQLTLIGWIPAAIWAVVVVNRDQQARQYRALVNRLHR